MTINLNDIPWVRIAAIILSLFFGYRLAEVAIWAKIRAQNQATQLNQQLGQCQRQLQILKQANKQ